jgi:hypothetical protein
MTGTERPSLVTTGLAVVTSPRRPVPQVPRRNRRERMPGQATQEDGQYLNFLLGKFGPRLKPHVLQLQ